MSCNRAKTLHADDKYLRVVAYHEAGHAVVAWCLGVPLREVRIAINEGFCSHVMTISPSLDPEFMHGSNWARIKKRALILLAGEAAERVGGEMAELEGDAEMSELFRDAYTVSYDSVASGSDREKLREVVLLIFGQIGPKSIEWIDSVEEEVEEIVIKHWRKICSLGEILIAKRVLSGDEATYVIQNT